MKRLTLLLLMVACNKEPAPAAKTAVVPDAQAAAPAAAPLPTPLAEGTVAPDFEVVAHDGKTYKLAALAGTPVVLYFFPKADTPG